MGRYSPLVSVTVEHEYFAGNRGPGLQFIPSAETVSLLERMNLLFRVTPRSANIFVDEDRLEALALEASQSADPVSLMFKVFATDPAFKSYTDPAVLRPGTILFFENPVATPPDVPLLHSGSYAGEDDFRSLDEVGRIPGLLTSRDLASQPDFILKVNLQKNDFQPGGLPRAGRSYQIRFQARRTIWKYYVLGSFKRDVPGINDVGNRIEFEFIGEELLPGDRKALTYRSKTAIPLREQHEVRFQLREKNGAWGKVLMRRLPVASANQFGMQVIDGQATMVSEIYINC